MVDHIYWVNSPSLMYLVSVPAVLQLCSCYVKDLSIWFGFFCLSCWDFISSALAFDFNCVVALSSQCWSSTRIVLAFCPCCWLYISAEFEFHSLQRWSMYEEYEFRKITVRNHKLPLTGGSQNFSSRRIPWLYTSPLTKPHRNGVTTLAV